jgi:hypothetical protein
MDAMGTKMKARTIAGLMVEVEVGDEDGDAVVEEGKMAGLEIIKEYLAVSFRQEGEH